MPPRSNCPIANTLDLVGDRWTLVIVRDLMFSSRRRYNELLHGPEGITTNILAARLKRLEAAGIVNKSAYQDRPRRYEYALTDKGLDLYDTLCAVIRWGGKHAPGSARLTDETLSAMDPRKR
ncbi:MAG: helix-turn-helix domain-containing protein [Polyangiaceae bacterium]